MKPRIQSFLLIFLIFVAGCSADLIGDDPLPSTPFFVTATLPILEFPLTTGTPSPTLTAAAVTITAIPLVAAEGVTTTQINLRTEPSTGSEALGLIPQAAAVQVIGRDQSGTWFLILESSGRKGWGKAEFVQVTDKAGIPVMGSLSGPGAGVSALVIEKINIRSGPGTEFEPLAVLNPNDVVFLTGRDPQGQWGQVEFPRAGEGIGWTVLKYLQVENPDALQVIGTVESTPSMEAVTALPAAPSDNDSAQSPLASVTLSVLDTRIFQLTDQVSHPSGDIEDWIEVTSEFDAVRVELTCNSGLQFEIIQNGKIIQQPSPACGNIFIQKATPGEPFTLHIFPQPATTLIFETYSIQLKGIP